MNKSHALHLSTLVAAFVSSACLAADASRTLDKTDRALSAAEQVAARLKQLGDKLGQPAASTAAGPATNAVADGNAAPGAAAPRQADRRDRPAYDPLAPPKRLVGVHGVKLGGTVVESNALLEAKGWTFANGGDGGSGPHALWRKGALTLQYKADRRGRIDSVKLTQEFKSPAEGQFDVAQVRQELIARYGSPVFDTVGKAGAHLQWTESPHARSYKEMTSATQPQKDQIQRGPFLDAGVTPSQLNLSFTWSGLAMQISDDYMRQKKVESENAPKKKAALD